VFARGERRERDALRIVPLARRRQIRDGAAVDAYHHGTGRAQLERGVGRWARPR
jgi:hypothetical protein